MIDLLVNIAFSLAILLVSILLVMGIVSVILIGIAILKDFIKDSFK